MEATIDQSELFSEFPLIDAKSQKRSPVRELIDATEKHGTLLPQWAVVSTLGVSKQRVNALVSTGRLATVEVAGKTWVPAVALELYMVEGPRRRGSGAKAA
jgi:hypothetical protein